MSRLVRCVSLASVVLLAAASSACGGSSAPKTPEEAVDLALKAIVDGKIDTIRAALPTKADFLFVMEKSGKGDKADKVDGELAEIEAKVPKSLTEMAETAKSAGLDLSTAKVTKVDSKEKADDGLTEVRIEATIASGDKQGTLKLRAVKLDRGLVMFRPPRLEVAGLCQRAIDNVLKVSTGVEDEMAKSINQVFGGDQSKIIADCEKGLAEKPESKAQVECMAGAADWAAAQVCMKN